MVPYDFDKTGIVFDYGDYLRSKDPDFKKPYTTNQSYFNYQRFFHYRPFIFLTEHKFNKKMPNQAQIKKLFIKYANLIYPKKDQVLAVLDEKREFLEAKNYEFMRSRLEHYFVELGKVVKNPGFNFYTWKDYITHLKVGDLEAKNHAIKAISFLGINKDESFNHIYPLYFKKENWELKRLINQKIVFDQSFGEENKTKFLKLARKK